MRSYEGYLNSLETQSFYQWHNRIFIYSAREWVYLRFVSRRILQITLSCRLLMMIYLYWLVVNIGSDLPMPVVRLNTREKKQE